MRRAKKALLFEKRSKNFCLLARALRLRPCPNNKKFFGSFFQKTTPSLLAAAVASQSPHA
jgi:hypothetical protein